MHAFRTPCAARIDLCRTVFARYAQRFRRDRDALGQEMRDIAGDQAGVLRVGVAYTRSRAIIRRL